MEKREQTIARLEEADDKMRQSGACEQWFQCADREIRAVAAEANGQLFSALLRATGYVDHECADMLRHGMRL